MFEKEAEEYTVENVCSSCYFEKPCENKCEAFGCADSKTYVLKAFKDGAEYGYNKANEWHYPSKGEYPEENKIVLIYAKNEEGYGHDFMTYHKDNGWYGYGSYCKEVIAWKELDTPKESK